MRFRPLTVKGLAELSQAGRGKNRPSSEWRPKPRNRRAPRSPSRVGTPERRHGVRDALKHTRRQRGERRGERRAAAGLRVGYCAPLAREHHGDEHLEPLHTRASVTICTTLASVVVSRLCAMACVHAPVCVMDVLMRA